MSDALATREATTLDQRRDRILGIVDRAALEVGAELIAAKREHPGEFFAWVARSLPFGVDKAERLMAIARAFGSIEASAREALPPAWTAMFELSRLPVEQVQRSIETGEIHPKMTVADARELVTGLKEAPKAAERTHRTGPEPGSPQRREIDADLVAAKLIRTDRKALSAFMEAQIRTWLGPEPPQETP